MAYTGTGTETDPYIVDNWTDFMSAVSYKNPNKYVKWADTENKICDLSQTTIINAVTIYAKSVDFNGWKLILNNFNYTASDQKYHRLFNLWGTETIKNVEIVADIQAYILFMCNQASSSVGTGRTFTKFTNVYADITTTKNTVYFASGNWISEQSATKFDKCVFKITQKHSTTYADDKFYMCYYENAGSGIWLENCEIDLDLSDTVPRSDLADLFDSNGGITYFKNCYVHGNLGKYTSLFPNPASNYNRVWNSIFDFTFDADSISFDYFKKPLFNNSSIGGDTSVSDDTLFPVALLVENKPINVLSSGDAYTLGNSIKISSEDVKKYNIISKMKFPNPDFYSGETQINNFSIQQDDSIRYSQFNNTDNENWTFRINSKINDGKPFLPFWKYNVPVVPTVSPVPYRPAIRVHDGASVRTAENKNYNFETNGIRIIFPIFCKVTEELNGLYICELEHHIDDEGDWLTLAANNILSVPIVYHDKETQQLFRITNVNPVSSSRTVKITARHIFYDLIARSIDTASVVNLDGYHALYYLFNAVYINESGEPISKYWYNYQFASDITDTYSAEYEITNLAAAIVGEDNSVINQLHGELYRDNFYFSINKEKEHCIKNENVIAYGVDMIDIDCNINWDNFCNYLFAKDNFGSEYAVSWADFYGGELGTICKVLRFNYDYSDMDRLIKDTNDYFDKVAQPDANYTIKFAKLKNTELYKDFINMKNNEVGDTIKIRHYQLNIDTELKIIKKVYDVLRQETESIEVGAEKANIIKKRYLSDTIFRSSADVRALEKRLS